MKFSSFILLLFLSLQVFPQKYLAPNEYHYSLTSRMHLLIIQDTLRNDTLSIQLNFKTGPFIETNELNGLSYFYQKLFTNLLKANIRNLAPAADNIKIKGETSLENVAYFLSFPKTYLEVVLKAIASTLSQPIYEKDAAEAIRQEINAEYAELIIQPEFTLHQATAGLLWSDFIARRTLLQPLDSLEGLERRLNFIRDKYYCPGNAFLTIRGNVQVKNTFDKIKFSLDDLTRCTLDAFVRYPIPLPKVLQFNVQMVNETEFSATPFYQVSFQAPTSFIDKRALLAAMIFSEMVASPKTKLYQAFHDSSFIQAIQMNYVGLRYSSEMSFIIIPDSGMAVPAYQNFWKIIRNSIDSACLSPDDLESIRQAIVEKYLLAKSTRSSQLSLISDHWASSSLDDYSVFADSISAITLEDIHHFIRKYILENQFASGLSVNKSQREQLGIDSAFTRTASEPVEYLFYFQRNTAHFVNTSQDSIVNSLIQFMKINPTVRLKINGVAESTEYLQVADAEIIKFVRTLPNLEITPASLIPTKKIRLDVYRSMQIIKKLIEAGIDQKRLVGTGQLVKPEKPLDSNLRAYCTLVR